MEGRKFDIRVLVLVTQKHECFIYNEGYVRTSSDEFNLEKKDQTSMHLTNNAIQKGFKNYGAFEEGNILSYQQANLKLKGSIDLEKIH